MIKRIAPSADGNVYVNERDDGTIVLNIVHGGRYVVRGMHFNDEGGNVELTPCEPKGEHK